MEGPYFKPNSPRRTSLVTPSTPGVPLTVSGYVFGRACRPISGALLDFWQADTNGAYDMAQFNFRATSSPVRTARSVSPPSCRASTRAVRATST